MATATSNGENANSMIEGKANEAAAAVANGMESLAGVLRDHTPNEGVVHSASSSVADSLECGGRLPSQHGASDGERKEAIGNS